MTRALANVLRTGRYLTIGALIALGCRGKDGRYFVPNPFGPPIEVTDLIPPTIENVRPATDIVISEQYIVVDVFDEPGGSGLDPASLTALYGTQQLPYTRVGASNTYNFGIGVIGEGARTLSIRARDYKGNVRERSVSFRTDWSGPSVTSNSPASGSSTQFSAQVNFSGTFGDPNGITVGTYYIRQPVNGQCSPTGTLFPIGTGPGMVSQNQFQLGTGGNYNFDVTWFGPPNEQRPQTTTLCGHAHLEDAARDVNNNPRPNPTDRTWTYGFTWGAMPPSEGTISGRVTVNTTTPLPGVTVSIPGRATTTDANGNYSFANVPVGSTPVTISNIPADVLCSILSKTGTVSAGQTTSVDFNCLRFNVTAEGLYRHIAAGISETCARISGLLGFSTGGEPIALENIAGASYTVQWAGPGTVGPTSRSGTLNAQSQAIDRQQINAFGTYTANIAVTYQGATKQVTASVTVGPTQGTCPPP